MPTAEEYKIKIDAALDGYFRPAGLSWDRLRESERYSLTAGGKRLRPMLALEFCRLCGGNPDAAMPAACAVEMLHTYSLIHDDLPCMDDDALRRGRPTNHIVYGECVATLAGDALQADAFAALLDAPLPPERVVACAQILARAAGSMGMCAGQYLDTAAPPQPDERSLRETHALKTGALISAACQIGVAAAGGTQPELDAAGAFGSALGMAFQIRDDVLDAQCSSEQLGKTAGSDERGGKTTFFTLLGPEGCEREIARLGREAKDSLAVFQDTAFLLELTDRLAARDQ